MEEYTHGHQAGDGQAYHEVSGLQESRLIDEFLKPIPGETILDIGCGTGHATLKVASLVGESGRVVGVDPGESRIDVARAELLRQPSLVPIVTYMKGSVKEAMPLAPFDAVFSNDVFHWFERADRQAIVTDIYKCLKPAGRLAIYLLTPQTQAKCLGVDAFHLSKPTSDIESASGIKFDPPAVWSHILTEAGFLVEVCEEKDEEVKAPNIEAALTGLEIYVPKFKIHRQLLRDSDIEI